MLTKWRACGHRKSNWKSSTLGLVKRFYTSLRHTQEKSEVLYTLLPALENYQHQVSRCHIHLCTGRQEVDQDYAGSILIAKVRQ